MDIEPITSLAFAMHTNPGGYAFLLGSGPSSAAAIPTGWDVVIDLTRRLTAAEGKRPFEDAVAWYIRRFGEDPSYSKLIGRLAPTQAERMSLLKGYFEPNDIERESGLKRPTAAHRALSQLVADGYVRVILTTNFDRLLEQALDEVGVVPIVIRSADDIAGAPSPMQSRCTLLKVNGDYLDTRIRNTEAELADYPPAMNGLLDRLCGEFGLVIVGWSGDWDVALRNALTRTADEARLSTFWTARSDPGAGASEVIQARGAHVTRIRDADSFLTELKEAVYALRDLAGTTSLSTRMVVATAKRLAADPSGRIRLHDLLHERVFVAREEAIAVQELNGDLDDDSYLSAVQRVSSATVAAMGVAATIAYWADPPERRLLCDAVREAVDGSTRGGLTALLDLRVLPGALIAHAIGTAAVAAENWDLVVAVLHAPVQIQGEPKVAGAALTHRVLADDAISKFIARRRNLPTGQSPRTPRSDYVRETVREAIADVVPDEGTFDNSFDYFEFLLSVVATKQSGYPGPIGRWVWRTAGPFGLDSASARFATDLAGDDPWPIALGLFATREEATQLIAALGPAIQSVMFR
jgi:hypothetical protein